MRAVNIVASLLAALVLAGCTEAATTLPGDGAAASSGPALDEENGAIRVSVTTSEQQPVGRAQVLLSTFERALLTGDDGSATFDALPPSSYTVVAANPGYRAQETRGRVVDVVPGETANVKLVLNPIETANASNAYHQTTIFRGHLGCSIATANGGAASTCRGVGSGGVVVSDPNEKSIHPLLLENAKAWSVVLESKWTPTMGGLAPQMHLSLNRIQKCSPGCSVDGQLFGKGGTSPLYTASSADSQVAKYVAQGGEYPAAFYVAMRATCDTGCTGASIAFQQTYDAYGTVFYAAPPPPGFRFIPAN